MDTKENKLTRIDVSEERFADETRYFSLRIGQDGELLLEGQDFSRAAEETWGDREYEYWTTVPSGYKDTVLLWLLKERFDSMDEVTSWLNEKGIPNSFKSW